MTVDAQVHIAPSLADCFTRGGCPCLLLDSQLPLMVWITCAFSTSTVASFVLCIPCLQEPAEAAGDHGAHAAEQPAPASRRGACCQHQPRTTSFGKYSLMPEC